MTAHTQFQVQTVSPSYWKVTFDNGPINLIDPDTVDQLSELVGRIEADPELTVVVFHSANPDFFMAHFDLLSEIDRIYTAPPGPTGLIPFSDNLLRLSKVPVVTISAITGRVRGAGSEFILNTDIRFAGANAIFGQPEIGFGAVPGGNPMGRLAELVGRGRAMEIVLGGDDYSAQLAAEYGYVNRVLPADELDDFVDAFALRIAGFSKAAVSSAKEFIDAATEISAGEFAAAMAAFRRTAMRPENADHIQSLFDRGLQKPDGVELDLGRQVAVRP